MSKSQPEMEEFLEQYRKRIAEESRIQLESNSELIARFIAICSDKGMQLGQSDFYYVPTIGVVAKYPGLVSKLLDCIPREKDGLVSMSWLNGKFRSEPFQSGYMRSDNFMVMVHPNFRRKYYENNNYAPHFVEMFTSYRASNIEKYIALDENRVRINIDSCCYIEEDTWYGAPFNRSVGEIENGVSVLKPPQDIEEPILSFLFSDTYALNVKWSEGRGVKTFQSIEFKNDGISVMKEGVNLYPARYMHAEFDIGLNEFRHFDGAVQYLTESEYFERRDSDFNFNVKSRAHQKPLSEKMFKINGSISVDDFVNLATHYFTADPLIVEYFSGNYPRTVSEAIDRVRAKRSTGGDT